MFRFDPVPDYSEARVDPPISQQPEAESRPEQSAVDGTIKRVIDIAVALTFFLVFGPLYVAVALCIWLGGGAPVHCWQMRLGKDGKPFRLYKFRLTVSDADRVLEEFLAHDPAARVEWDCFQMLKNDPRIVPVGKILCKFGLDELPLFWNVLRGDMSLVGPRPCLQRQRSLYGSAWNACTTMRPGLTGLWHLQQRQKATFAQRVELDVEYVNRWSLWLDCKILSKTVRTMLFGIR